MSLDLTNLRELLKRLEHNGWREDCPQRYAWIYRKKNWTCRIDLRYGVQFWRS